MTCHVSKAVLGLFLFLVSAVPAAAETYEKSYAGSYGSPTLGASYMAEFAMTNTPTSSSCSAYLAATGSWMGTSYSLFSASYEAENTLGTGSADVVITYKGAVVYSKSVAKTWKWKWSKSKTVFEKSKTFMVLGAPVSVAMDCKWSAETNLNLALTPTGAGADGMAKFKLTASGSAGVSVPILTGSVVVKITIIEVKPSGEMNANFDYLYASVTLSAKAEIDIHLLLTIFGFTVSDTEIYKEYPYSKTWSYTKGF